MRIASARERVRDGHLLYDINYFPEYRAVNMSRWMINQVKILRHRRRFLTPHGGGTHCGVFSSFAHARQWLPKSPEFDTDEYSKEYIEIRRSKIYPFDYPVIFWLRTAFENGASSIFDVGGSVGVHYYSYRNYLDYPDGLQWKVMDLPRAVRQGRELAARESATRLTFTDELDPADVGADILMSAGAIEFLETTGLDWMLASAARKPRHILLNKVPLYDGERFVSTHNLGGGAYAPHHVFNAREFVESVERHGYVLADRWKVPERSMILPDHPQRSFDAYSGLYFRRD